MSKKNKSPEQIKIPLSRRLKEETLQGIIAILCFVLAIFFAIVPFKLGGIVGAQSFRLFSYLLGVGYFLLPLLLVGLGVSFLRSLKRHVALSQSLGGLMFLLSGLGMINIVLKDQGGSVGAFVSMPLVKLFDITASLIFLAAMLLIAILVMFDIELVSLAWWRKEKDEDGEKKPFEEVGKLAIENEAEIAAIPEKEKEGKMEKGASKESEKDKGKGDEFKVTIPERNRAAALTAFTPLPLSLLEGDRGKPGVGDIKANANIIKRTLQNFGINVEMDEVSIGPSVTRYALKPAEGVKLSRIVGLQNDLSLALAAHPIRIEAPIPGKSLVGIEIPNTTKTTVGLATLLSDSEYQQSEKPLLVALGKGISGKSHFANLAKMPHLLIAGATGSGKSVTIHAIITSLLYRNSPESLKFIMIDPKRVELTLYNKIPHLLTPVVTEAKKAILALKWAAKEMDRRYDILETESVRDIESYHKNILAPALKKFEKKKPDEESTVILPETLPYIVVVIDELADIMQAYPRELESAIVRLAQMSRAVGIHLILSTQRPSVNVITGLIKANVPARVALQVSSQIDSRTILDTGGAEKLLGAGDMLYLSGEMSQPTRIQSAFISETELKNVVKFLIDHNESIPSEINISGNNNAENKSIFEATLDEEEVGEDDDLYEEAKEEILKAGRASTSYLQRKLRIGYARAARLMDMLEQKGVIGAADGAKPRDVMGSSTPTDTPPPAP